MFLQRQPHRDKSAELPATFCRMRRASFITLAGSQLTAFVLPTISIILLKATPFEAAALVGAEHGSSAISSFAFGRAADRVNLVRSMRIVAVTGAIGISVVPVSYAAGFLSLSCLLVAGLVVGISAAVFDVASQTLVPSLTLPPDWPTANTRLQVNRSAAMLLGPAIGGISLYFTNGPAVLGIDALSYLICLALLMALPSQLHGAGGSSERPESGAGRRAAVRCIMANPVLRTLLLTTVTMNVGGAILGGLYFSSAYRLVGISPTRLGFAAAIGASLAVFVSRRTDRALLRFGPGLTFLTASCLIGLSYWLIPLSTIAAPFVFLLVYEAGFSTGASVYSIAQATLRQISTPMEIQGAVFGTLRGVSVASIPVGYVVGGLVGSRLGIANGLVLGALVGTLTIIFALSVRNYYPAPWRSLA